MFFVIAKLNKSFESAKLNLVGEGNFLSLNGFADNANIDVFLSSANIGKKIKTAKLNCIFYQKKYCKLNLEISRKFLFYRLIGYATFSSC